MGHGQGAMNGRRIGQRTGASDAKPAVVSAWRMCLQCSTRWHSLTQEQPEADTRLRLQSLCVSTRDSGCNLHAFPSLSLPEGPQCRRGWQPTGRGQGRKLGNAGRRGCKGRGERLKHDWTRLEQDSMTQGPHNAATEQNALVLDPSDPHSSSSAIVASRLTRW